MGARLCGHQPPGHPGRIGHRPGSMYHHFTGKGDLAAEALRESALVLRAEAEALLTGPGSPLGRIETYLTRQRDSLRGCRVGR